MRYLEPTHDEALEHADANPHGTTALGGDMTHLSDALNGKPQ
jgi:hypothetical protein